MLFGEHPLRNSVRNMKELQTRLEENAVGDAILSYRNSLSPGCFNMLIGLCIRDTSRRMSFDEFIHHSWLKTGDDFCMIESCVIENYENSVSEPIPIQQQQSRIIPPTPNSFTNFLNISVELFKCSMTDYFHSV
jgi:hypothetical protein